MDMPLVSIIIPGFNVEKTIERTIKSILDQDYDNYEVIFVDDGSTDDTSKVVKAVAYIEPRIHYYYQQNCGQGSARNNGIIHSKGKYICFIDADDVISSNYLNKLVGMAEQKNADIVLADLVEVKEETGQKILKEQQIIGKDRISHVMPTYHSKLWNKEFYIKCDTIQPNIIFEDVATVPYFLCMAKVLVFAHGCEYYYYQYSKSTVTRIDAFSHRELALKHLCRLFIEKGVFECYREQLYNFVLARYFADVSRLETMIDNIADTCSYVLRQYFDTNPNDFFTYSFLYGSYNTYRSSKYIRGNRILFRYMATTIESVCGAPYSKLRDVRIVRKPILRQENVINDCSKRFMSLNPVECENVSVFLIDFLDERFDVGYDMNECITISDALMDDESVELPPTIVPLENRVQQLRSCIDVFLKKLKTISQGKKVIMIRMLLSERYGNEYTQSEYAEISQIRSTNSILNELYDLVESKETWIESIKVDDIKEYYTEVDFRYGCHPWHLNEMAYKRIGDLIMERLDNE